MTLETIVPSLEDCKRIPQGSFSDSALVWLPSEKIAHVYARDQIAVYSEKTLKMCIPAPTLSEILAELPTVGCIVRVSEVGGNVEYTASLPLSDIEETNTNPATAALRLWMRLKGVQG